jgi:hypothetical protein
MPPTVGLTRFIYVRSMAFESTSRFLTNSRLVFESLLFIANKMGDLHLQEPESQEITGSDTDRFPPTLVQVSLACEAWLRHESSRSGESMSDSLGKTSTTMKFIALTQQIQSTSHCRNLILTAAKKSSWWGKVKRMSPHRRPQW